ncbi:hypothetical protein AMS59_14205 [Lysinibacillus sp. FJAT-14745]|nr:hypothetical protein AMS59_14205 [Lysinibacillus sp. FJAT-14745]
MNQHLDSIENRLESVENRLESVENRLESVESRLESVESRLESVENRLEVVEFEQQQIKQAVLETNEKVNRLAVIQESQHRIIELLSARSIQHEAELKRMSDLQVVV